MNRFKVQARFRSLHSNEAVMKNDNQRVFLMSQMHQMHQKRFLGVSSKEVKNRDANQQHSVESDELVVIL